MAVIDEIQMLRDEQRGYAWTRALLGVAADEVHVCGEVAAIDIVKALVEPIGETVEVGWQAMKRRMLRQSMMNGSCFQIRQYERMSPLTVARTGLGTLSNTQPGDCFVCFSRKVQ